MTFLLEIGTEELPASHAVSAIKQLETAVPVLLDAHRLKYRSFRVYGTPRRLAVVVEGVAASQPDRTVEVMGPAVRVGLDASGAFLPPAIGFAKGQGLKPEQLVKKTTDKGELFCAVKQEKGRKAVEVLAEAAQSWIRGLKFPKSMRWETEERFSRPIRWITALCDRQAVKLSYGGVSSVNTSRGHSMLSPAAFPMTAPQRYLKELAKRKVMADPADRQTLIQKLADQLAKPYGRALLSKDLLEEISFLVEWPAAVLGRFDEKFLALPPEVLVMVMEKHQRYMPIEKSGGGLAPAFVVMTNGVGKADVVRRGHEKVIAARLSDAEFFFREDQKKPLGLRVEELKGVVWLEGLGTLYEKTERLAALVGALSETMGIQGQEKEAALRAGRLAKADQVTELVKEIPELEGLMGGYYARLSGEPEPVAAALTEMYWPRGDHGGWPISTAGRLLNLAERLDHVVGCFAVGKIPTGSEDPYGARRQAVAVVHMLLSLEWRVPLRQILADHIERFHLEKMQDHTTLLNLLSDFFRQRAEAAFTEQKYAVDLVRAVLSAQWFPLTDAQQKVKVLTQLRQRSDFKATMITFSRVTNILPKVLKHSPASAPVDPSRFREEAERHLHERFDYIAAAVLPLWKRGEYLQGFEQLCELRPAIDQFFEKVMVMAEDKQIQSNRLNLLHHVNTLFLQFADFSQIVLS